MRDRATGQNLTYQIVQDLGLAIVTGRYSAANPFPVEAELSKQYGASRSILREAVKMLTAKGLLGARPGRGTRVEAEENWNLLDPDVLRWLLDRKFSPSLLMEFNQVRLAFEPKAAAFAALNASPAAKAEIRRALEVMAMATESEDSLAADIAFHVAVLRASGNRFFAQLHELIESTLRFSIRATNSYKGVPKASVADHQKVSDAIFAGNPQLAEDAMRELVQEALDLIKFGSGQVSSELETQSQLPLTIGAKVAS